MSERCTADKPRVNNSHPAPYNRKNPPQKAEMTKNENPIISHHFRPDENSPIAKSPRNPLSP
ncbi:MAG: hypothetical protein CMO55_16570 [Verrucomicrobiales bacterium]|nr:hypothetical protein [Verrucomicrobiales bacterium]